MLVREEIENAVGIQKLGYKLLLWVGEAVDEGYISFTQLHEHESAADVAFDWIGRHYQNIPEAVRPSTDQLRPFSNYFGSYVTTSFDLIRDPGQRQVSPCGCSCELCSYLVDASHLQVLKPSKHDKDRAKRGCVSRIEMLAQEEGFQVTRDEAAALAISHRREAAYSAYGMSLLKRIKGSVGGPHILALWRMIAWKPEGSPIRGFRLKAEDIFDAEHKLVVEIANCAAEKSKKGDEC